MKKYFYTILAAVAIVASCAKEADNGTSQTLDKASSLFSGTIIQPNGLTKVSIIDQKEDESNVYIQWNSGDKIWVKKNRDAEYLWSDDNSLRVLTASQDGVTVNFVGDTDGWADDLDYAARFYGKNDAWRSYVLSQHSGYDLDLKNFSDGDSPVLLENMPLYCGKSGKKDDNINYFVFSSEHAILQINVPKKLDFDDLFVCLDQDVTFESGSLTYGSSYTLRLINADGLKEDDKFAGKDYVTYFVPVRSGDLGTMRIIAAKGTLGTDMYEVARMSTYEYNASISLGVNTIYFFDFCNTKTIKEAGTYSLESNNGIDYKVNIAADIDGNVTINAEVEGKEPANIYINNRGHKISGILTINASKSHVEGENGIATEVITKTSNSTFVVKPTLTITGLTVKKGSVVVEGKEDNTANVSTVTIPTDVEGPVSIDVTGVSAEGNERVEIVNNSAPENVTVVIEKDDKTAGGDSKEYYITQNEVTPVEKDIVATIGKTGYETLAKAVEAVKSNETIVLVKDVELSDPIVTDKTFTLTLNANISPVSTWEGGGYKDGIIIIKRGGNLTINGSGKILNNDVKNAYAAVKMTQKDEPDGVAAKLTVDGNVTLEGYYYGIVGGGNRHNTEITINGGIIKGYNETDCQGIYHPQDGKLTINGGVVSGYNSAIELRGGTFVINGGTLTCTASPLAVESNGSGSTTMGASLAIAQHTTKKDINVTVNGGTLNGYKAISVTNPENNDTENVAVTYKAGTLNGGITLGHGTFNLDGNLAVKEPVKVIGKTTLDLGTSTLSAAEGFTRMSTGVIIINRKGDLTVEGTTGSIASGNNAYSAVVLTEKTVDESDTTVPAKLTVEGGNIIGMYYGISGSGNTNRKNTSIVINGGTVKQTYENDGAAIFHPQNGTLTIKGGTIEGATGIYVKSGSVTTEVEGGTINGIGEKHDYKTTGDGLQSTGDAIVFDNCDYPGGEPNAAIKGGKFHSANASAVGSYAKTGKEPITGFISGGLFSTKPAADLIVEGKAAVENTDDATKTNYPWKVAEAQAQGVAKIGSTYYETLDAAISAASAGQTITLVSNIALDKEITISKGITIDGNNFTIAVSDAEYWNQYKVGGANQGLGTVNMITVKADNFTLKNVTLDGKDCRGVSLCTTKSGKNVLYQNITYTGRGSGHYYGEATGLVTFDGCKFDIHGYAVHFGGESSVDDDVVIKNCELNGWSSFGFCKSLTITDSHFGGANDEGKNGWLAVLRPYCPTTITNCTFSDIYLHEAVSGYQCIGLGTGAATTVVLKGCKIVDDAKQELVGAEIYSIVRDNGFDNDAAKNGSVFAFDATGNATDGFTDGMFYAFDPAKIKVQTGYEAYAIEGKTNVYGIREAQGSAAIKTQAEFETACTAAKSGDKLVLDEGEFAITSSTVGKKELSFKGQGNGTIIRIGNSTGDGNQGTGTCNDSPKLSFENLSLTTLSGKEATNYTGFTHEGELYFKDVTFLAGFSNWGNQSKNVTFVNCTFNQYEKSWYCVQELRVNPGTKFLFDNCKFICTKDGRFINAYTQYGGEQGVEIVVKDCTFDGSASTQSKAALNLKSGSNGCPINCYFLGRNTVNNVKVQHEATGSALFADTEGNRAKVYVGTSKETAVLIWENQGKTEQYIKPEDFNPES